MIYFGTKTHSLPAYRRPESHTETADTSSYLYPEYKLQQVNCKHSAELYLYQQSELETGLSYSGNSLIVGAELYPGSKKKEFIKSKSIIDT